LLKQKNKLTLGGKGWRSSILTGRGVSKFIDLYILKGGMTSSDRMLMGYWSQSELTLGGTGLKSSNLTGRRLFLYILKGGMTS